MDFHFLYINSLVIIKGRLQKKREKFGDFAQKEGGGQFQNPNIFTLKLGHFIEEGGGQSKNSQIF